MSDLSIVPLKQPKRLNDFQDAVQALIDSDDFGKLTVAETIGVLQIIVINLWHRITKESE